MDCSSEIDNAAGRVKESGKQMKFLYLHGLGQKPDSWNRVIKETKVSDSSVSLSLAEMLEGQSGHLWGAVCCILRKVRQGK